MNQDASPNPSGPQSVFAVAKDLVIALIFQTDDRSEQKERIMIAREESLISDEDAQSLIERYGLGDA
jgi:hypothetical protein